MAARVPASQYVTVNHVCIVVHVLCYYNNLSQPWDHLRNLEIAAHYKISENVLHNFRIAQIPTCRLDGTDICIFNHTVLAVHEFSSCWWCFLGMLKPCYQLHLIKFLWIHASLIMLYASFTHCQKSCLSNTWSALCSIYRCITRVIKSQKSYWMKTSACRDGTLKIQPN